jgi:hypothetical protein
LAAHCFLQASQQPARHAVLHDEDPALLAAAAVDLSSSHICMQAEVKSSLLLSPGSHYRGYQPLGLNVTRHAAGFTPDWHEALDLFREEEPAAAKVRHGAATTRSSGRRVLCRCLLHRGSGMGAA